MADGADTRVNLAALKRVDPYAVEIVETGTQVAIYKFNSQSNEWEKTDVEGTLFLYARSGDPRHGFVVMNRLSTENLVEPITRDLEIQLQAPFLLYKNAKLSITGVWFYEESECTRIAQKLEALVKEETERRRPNLVQEKSNVDIMSLLTKAGQEYEQKGKPVSTSSSVDVVRPTALRPASNGGNTQSTPLSVADLFGMEPIHQSTQMPLHHCGGSLFERLMSAGTPTGVPPPPLPNAELHTAQSLERELRGKEKSKANGTGEHPLPHAAPMHPSVPTKPGGLINHSAVLIRPHIAEVMQKNTSGTPPRHVGLQSVALMSPMMFTSASGTSEQPVETVRVQTPVQRPAFQPQEESHHPYLVDNEITPLTKAQLMQAFNYLLKLHDAYVQSLKQSLKTGH
uniref:EOG090X07B6 n=1 Tax=Daphnia similis TaxID=35528 RepID=A0A4Y7N1C0_9CRUS|nr:EOG090X07B6 [Daphnia similis]SVE86789.1 EOG090X07B6 [Daphnia similis]SVE87415.1 EOG090X07B6 [Daphnia similis]